MDLKETGCEGVDWIHLSEWILSYQEFRSIEFG
jgi:hypothetical protein